MNEFEQLKELQQQFKTDPYLYVTTVLKAQPTEQQTKALKAIGKPGAKVSIKSGHGTGKSALLAWIALWFITNFPDAIVPCTAPTSHQLDDILWKELRFWRERMHPYYAEQIEITQDRVRIKGLETNFAVARTARKENPDALQGFHAPNLLFLIDEGSGVPESIFEVARGALSTPEARVLIAGNPTQTTGFFFESHHKMRDTFNCLTFSCIDSPLVSQQYIDDMIRDYGQDSDIYRVRVLGEFPNASVTQLIPLDLVEACIARHLTPQQYEFAPGVLGVDVAWYGDDGSSIYYRQGLRARELFYGRGIDNMTLGGIVARFQDDLNVEAVFIDQGWGAGVIDYGNSFGRAWIPVPFGGSAYDPRYVNRRTEMWCTMKDWMTSGASIPFIKQLRDDLIGPQYGFTGAGKIQLERKEDMKKRGFASPDRADALALTFAEPLAMTVPVISPSGVPINNTKKTAETKYNPFEGAIRIH